LVDLGGKGGSKIPPFFYNKTGKKKDYYLFVLAFFTNFPFGFQRFIYLKRIFLKLQPS
jgi:hypothetical protein